MNQKISIVIPFLNESENINELVKLIDDFSAQATLFTCEIIFVDDGSTDDSFELLKTSAHSNYSAKLIKLSRNYGSHAALRAGIANATGEKIVFYYADMQDPITLIGQMFDKMNEGFDIVWANREQSAVSRKEKLFSRAYARLMRRYAIPDFPENGFDIVMFNRKIKDELDKKIEANSSIFLQILSLGFKQAQISYKRNERKRGKSKWTLSKKIKLFIDSFISFSYAPIKMVTVVGALFFFLGIAWTIYIITREILIGDLSPGWPALVSILMMGFGITNISLGIIAEYLWRTLDVSRGRSVFLIDEIIEKNEKK